MRYQQRICSLIWEISDNYNISYIGVHMYLIIRTRRECDFFHLEKAIHTPKTSSALENIIKFWSVSSLYIIIWKYSSEYSFIWEKYMYIMVSLFIVYYHQKLQIRTFFDLRNHSEHHMCVCVYVTYVCMYVCLYMMFRKLRWQCRILRSGENKSLLVSDDCISKFFYRGYI